MARSAPLRRTIQKLVSRFFPVAPDRDPRAFASLAEETLDMHERTTQSLPPSPTNPPLKSALKQSSAPDPSNNDRACLAFRHAGQSLNVDHPPHKTQRASFFCCVGAHGEYGTGNHR